MTYITNVLDKFVFQFWKKKDQKHIFQNGHFSTVCDHFFGNYIDIFHKTGHFEMLSVSKS